MSRLFEPTRINGMKIKNRFVRSATYEAMATVDGAVTDPLPACMETLVRGGIGLVITGHAHVTRQGQAGPRQMGICSDASIHGLKQVAATVHENGGVVAVQLAHAGQRGIGKDTYSALGPCDTFEKGAKKASAMTADDIKRTVKAFGEAAERAVESGFDAIEIHAAHGYMLSQFLSPYYNKRNDDYGGSIENSARLLVEVYTEIRQRVGTSFPIMAKINSEDFLKGGLTVEEMIKIPLILVGGFLSFNIAEDVVTSGLADYVALSRPLIREPHLVKRWAGGDRRKASCISCNKCFTTFFMEEGLHCVAAKRKKSEL